MKITESEKARRCRTCFFYCSRSVSLKCSKRRGEEMTIPTSNEIIKMNNKPAGVALLKWWLELGKERGWLSEEEYRAYEEKIKKSEVKND